MGETMDVEAGIGAAEVALRVGQACKASLEGPPTASIEQPVAELVQLKGDIGTEAITEALSHRIAVLWELADLAYAEGKEGKEKEEKDTTGLGVCRGRIVRLVAALDRAGVIDMNTWQARCELELLEATNFIPSAADVRKKEVRYYTKAVYLQRRYNLMREASEGFAKAIAVLATLKQPDCDVQQVARHLKMVVGAFHLDPHRVLDLLLESLPKDNTNGSYAVLEGNLFDKVKVTHLLGWKFQDCHRSDVLTPDHLHDVAATLITCCYVDFDLLFTYLSPDAKEYHESISKVVVKLQEEIQKIERPAWERKPGQGPTANGSSQSSGARKGHFSINRVDVRSVEADVSMEILSKDNQVLGLAAAFLRSNPLTDEAAKWANTLMIRATAGAEYEYVERFNVPYCEAMLAYVERAIDPVYKKLFGGTRPGFAKNPFVSGASAQPAITSIMEDRKLILMMQFLAALGHRMSSAPATLCKVCWVLAHEAKFFVTFDCSDWTFMAPPPDLKPLSVEYVVAECLLPSLGCLPNCIQLAEDIHRIVQFFPYPSRFLTYTNALRCINADDITYTAGIMAEQAAKQIIRRVGNSEDRGNRDTVQSACQFRKLGVHAPFSVTAVLVSRAMSDDNLQEALALLMAQQMPLAFDAFGFWVIYHVINTKDSKVDNGEHSWWFKRLAKFLGRVCKEYPGRVPLGWLLQSIIQELYSQEIGDFHLLEEILGEMTGFKANSLVGENQMNALAGGPLLKSIILTTPWHKDKSYTTPSRCLVEVLRLPAAGLNKSDPRAANVCTIAQELMVLLNKAISCAPFMLESSDVKFTMEVTDRVMDSYVQFVDFLSYHLTREEYFRLLPPIQSVVNKYKCQPDWIFHAYRSLIVDIRDSERKEEGEICTDADEAPSTTPGKLTFQWMVHEVTGFEKLKKSGVWDALTPEFFTLFWTLTLSDLQFPEHQYVLAEAELEGNLKVVRDRLMDVGDRNRHGEDRARREERRNLEREKDFWKDRIRQLHAERDSQRRRVDHVKSFVRGIKDTLLASVSHTKFRDLETALVQHCFFPRIKMGMEEGQYTWEFMMFAHEIGMVNFHTIILLDRVIKEVFPMMHSMTDREGAGFRVFMGAFLKKMEAWRADEKLYEAECGNRPGCVVNVFTDEKNKKLMDHTGLLRLNYKWVNRLSRNLKDFLEPYSSKIGEDGTPTTLGDREAADAAVHRYVLRRSGLLMLNHVGKFFPVLKGLANHLKSAAGYVKDHSKDDQLKNMANHFFNELEREFERQDRWVDLKNFGGLPQEKLNALRQRDRADAQTPTQHQEAEVVDNGKPTGIPIPSGTVQHNREPIIGSRSQTRDQDHRSVRRSSPNLVSDPIGRGPIAVRDRDVGSGLRERESVSAPRDRERMSRALRSVPDPDETRPDGNTPADNQTRVERQRRVRDERIDSRRRTGGPGGRTTEEDARRYGQRPRRNA